jgi:hypothetical protein
MSDSDEKLEDSDDEVDEEIVELMKEHDIR